MMKKILFFLTFVVFLACQKDKSADNSLTLNYPDYFPAPVYQFNNNALQKDRFELGKKLFFDKNLSSNGSISCASCHSQAHAFADHNVSFSAGVGNQLGDRNSPSIANMIWSPSFMWDGGVNHIEVFSVAPLTNPVEMNETMLNVVNKLNSSSEYKNLFKKAYNLDVITDQVLLRALTIYMSMIVSADSRYDQYRQGKISLSTEEMSGLNLFRQKCASCHTEPLFTNYSFRNNGLDSVFSDLGRGRITNNPIDYGKFKVPSLRNVELTYPYMHDGRFWNLEEVLDHYAHGIVTSNTLDPILSSPMSLTDTEKEQIIKFLKTLTDWTLISNHLLNE
jgi:cytochrome c peroxidase